MARAAGSWTIGIFAAFLFFVFMDTYALLPDSDSFFDRRFWFSTIAYIVVRLLIAVETKLDSK